MNLLDENIPRDQADLLRHWKVRCHSISRDLGRHGIGDDAILPLLLQLKRPTLLTRDVDFFQRQLVHADYCLIWFDVRPEETAFFIRRFLRHSKFRSAAQRLGKVICVQPSKVRYWTRNAEGLMELAW